MGSPFATQEDSPSLWYEQSTYVSTHLASMGFGIHMIVFFTVTYYTWRMRASIQPRVWVFWLVFNTLLFALGTINLACSIRFNENAWVNDRAYPGGPISYLLEQQSVPFLTLGNVASILASFMSDGLLLYRAGVLWHFAWYIIIPPALFFVACIILSIMVVIQLALPTVSLPELSLAVWIVLMLLPIWLTLLIAGRILYHRRAMIDALGPEYAKAYTSVSAIVVESALPFCIISIVLLGLFGNNNTAQNLFVPLLVQVECIAPELIILRVVLGRSWTRGTMSGEDSTGTLSNLHFAPPLNRPRARSVAESEHVCLAIRPTRSRTDETDARARTSVIVLKDVQEKVDNPSGSTVNVV
ncbi:hypothetical protein C8R46DRAFT_483241 [Mycena filopes]|nr:hypothetical protein C8R46DRAFT_483241 [Mycena filopes]